MEYHKKRQMARQQKKHRKERIFKSKEIHNRKVAFQIACVSKTVLKAAFNS
jgi:hypothetical protein